MSTSTSIATPASYWDRPANYLRRNHRIELRAELVRELIGEPRGLEILDLGSGNGGVSAQFARYNDLTLVDGSNAMLRQAVPVRASKIHADLLAYTGDPANIVLAIGVLAHIADTRAVLASVVRNLQSGGLAVIQFSDADRPLNRLAHAMLRARSHATHLTRRIDVLDLAREQGLTPVAERSHLFILPGMPRILGRLLKPYDRWSRRSPKLASWSLDTLVLFQKVDA